MRKNEIIKHLELAGAKNISAEKGKYKINFLFENIKLYVARDYMKRIYLMDPLLETDMLGGAIKYFLDFEKSLKDQFYSYKVWRKEYNK